MAGLRKDLVALREHYDRSIREFERRRARYGRKMDRYEPAMRALREHRDQALAGELVAPEVNAELPGTIEETMDVAGLTAATTVEETVKLSRMDALHQIDLKLQQFEPLMDEYARAREKLRAEVDHYRKKRKRLQRTRRQLGDFPFPGNVEPYRYQAQ